MRRLLAIAAIFCMGSSLPTLKYRALDDDGNPISGALLYFYEDGTTTPLTTYSDEALSSANANPVVADSNGWFGEIYLKTDEAYKVVLKNSDASATYWTIDDINAAQLTSASIVTRLKQVASNPIDYGAVGDGVADESSYIQSAIDNATGVVDLLGKTYRCDSTITMSSGIVMKNGTLNFSNTTDNYGIYVRGDGVSTYSLLTGNASIGDTQVSITSTSGFSSDDFVNIASNDVWYGSIFAKETIQVDSVSGNDLVLKSPLEADYTTSKSATAYNLDMISDVVFENVTFIGNKSSSGNGDIVYLSYSSDVSFKSCTFKNFKRYAIAITDNSFDVNIEECLFEEGASTAYGIYTSDCQQWINISNNTFSRVPIGIGISDKTTGSIARWVTVSNNIFRGVAQAFVSGSGSQYINIINNDITCDTSGDTTDGNGIEVAGPDTRIVDNKVRESGGHGIAFLENGAVDLGVENTLVISGNTVLSPDNAGIYVSDFDYIEIVNIHDNIVYSSGAEGIYADGDDETRFSIDSNIISYPGTIGIYALNGIVTSIDSNEILRAGSDGIYLYLVQQGTSGIELSITNNNIRRSTDNGIVVNSVVADDYYTLNITGNSVNYIAGAGDFCLELSTSGAGEIDNVIISGNNFGRNADLDDTIQLGGAGAGDIDNVTISGNLFLNGAYAIGEPTDANNTNVNISGNTYSSIATGEYEGTVVPSIVVKAAANTACNTTCGDFTCFSGYDDGVPAVVVCTDATADRCLCFP